jgi:hypothetical protein
MKLKLRQLSTADADFESAFQRLLHWSADTDRQIEQRVAEILVDVKARGDAAVLDYTARFDGLQAASVAALELGRDELRAAFESIPAAQRSALDAAAQRVRSFHQRQLEACARSWSYRDGDGSLLGQKVTPLDRVGIYVPGGKAAYPSSVLMNAIPAQVAGVGEIVMVVPTPQGQKNPLVLAAAWLGGAHRVFTVGGAQAVAALAYGTADDSARRQDHRPRQRLRGQCQEACLRPGRHRHDRRAQRDPGACRWQHTARLGGDGPVQPGRARRAGAEHPAVPRCGLPPGGARGHRTAAAGHAAAGRDPCLAGRTRRADSHAQHGRGLRDQQPHRAGAPRDQLEAACRLGAAAAPRRRDLPRRLHQREPGRLLRRPEPRAAHLAARRASARRWACTTSSSAAA